MTAQTSARPAKRTSADFACLGLFALAFLYVASGIFFPLHRTASPIRPLAANPLQPDFSGTGFARDAVFPGIRKPHLSANLPFFGSWIGSDDSRGSMHSIWYPAKLKFSVFVAGYPSRSGLDLSLELRTASNEIRKVPISVAIDPGLHWQEISLSLREAKNIKEFRIVAADRATGWGGWIGISAPFVPTPALGWMFFYQLALVLLAVAAALVFFVFPGLALRQLILASRGWLLEFIWIPTLGLLLLSLLGFLAWIGPHFLSARLISRAGLGLLFCFIVHRLARVPLASYTSLLERKALFVLSVLVAIAAAKSTYSLGPLTNSTAAPFPGPWKWAIGATVAFPM